jgi:plastocyanin
VFFRTSIKLLLPFVFGLLCCLAALLSPDAVAEDAGQHPHSHEPNESGQIMNAGSITITEGAVSPGQLKVNPGQTVVWLNSSELPIRVTFLSKAVSTTCKGPRGFIVGNQGIFQSKTIAKGDVASLCFLEPENYDYKVEFFKNSMETVDPTMDLPGVVNVTAK